MEKQSEENSVFDNPKEIDVIEIKPEDKIYQVAIDKGVSDWKSLLYNLIHKEGLDPWDIDLRILTKKYLEALKVIKAIDFTVSGKFLTIAVFLLKTKAEVLVEKDLRGIEDKINRIQDNSEEYVDEIDALEDFDDSLNSELEENLQNKKEKYSLKLRNPLARKRKVNIFDLIKTLEKTFQQSNKRKANFFLRNPNVKYKGPTYEKKKKDLKTVIEDLFDFIIEEFNDKKQYITFSSIVEGIETKTEMLEKFIPLLHLHNQSRLEVSQRVHFGEINIHRIVDNKINKEVNSD